LPKFKDITGKVFGRLTVIDRVENKGIHTQWLVQCSCNNKTILKVRGQNLVTGNTKSCGCLLRESKEKLTGIYKIHNTAINKIYIGASKDIYTRHNQHILSLNYGDHYNKALQNDWNEYTESKFLFEILELCTADQLFEKEVYWIDKLNSYNEGYNDTRGGKGTKGFNPIVSPLKGRKLSEEHRQKIIKGRKNSKKSSKHLTLEEIDKVKQLLLTTQLTQLEIANIFKVTQPVISKIKTNLNKN
jgi:group I intron endonuclease